ncbi:hypothetical protein CC2G_002688 [Coprinopsis cinerea AmutBmut pab1-1]|nr:hypothetical protein CC2G_002688 [Coprinopsis cinerea AmutBmut pab1-1]
MNTISYTSQLSGAGDTAHCFFFQRTQVQNPSDRPLFATIENSYIYRINDTANGAAFSIEGGVAVANGRYERFTQLNDLSGAAPKAVARLQWVSPTADSMNTFIHANFERLGVNLRCASEQIYLRDVFVPHTDRRVGAIGHNVSREHHFRLAGDRSFVIEERRRHGTQEINLRCTYGRGRTAVALLEWSEVQQRWFMEVRETSVADGRLEAIIVMFLLILGSANPAEYA